MTNEYLTFKNLTFVNVGLLVIYGISFILIPADVLDLYDVSLSPEGDFMSKLLGAAFVLIAIIAWSIRDMEFSDLRNNISIGFIVGNAIGLILSIINRFDDNTDASALEWLNVFIYGILGAGYAYFTFIETDETKSVSSA